MKGLQRSGGCERLMGKLRKVPTCLLPQDCGHARPGEDALSIGSSPAGFLIGSLPAVLTSLPRVCKTRRVRLGGRHPSITRSGRDPKTIKDGLTILDAEEVFDTPGSFGWCPTTATTSWSTLRASSRLSFTAVNSGRAVSRTASRTGDSDGGNCVHTPVSQYPVE